MIEIRKEIAEVEEGKADKLDNVLKNAPHTHRLLLGDWTHAYSKEKAFFPLKGYPQDKYWPPVARVDNVFGDRNLVCTCPPMETYMEAAE
jgi:glycine dehydrogenase